ncbi:MAG: hypothetical protein MJZ70_01035 [Bacteroidales bacterium]|nr:hypothetical protein [Bacteroidales bacterium]
MKKLMLLIAACCMIFVACNNQKAEENNGEAAQTEQKAECKGENCCEKMMQQWANFDNLSAEEQTKLINKRGECIGKKLAAVNLDEIACPNAKAGIQEFKTKWEGFANADQAGKKALIDEFDGAHWKHEIVDCCGHKCDNKCGKENCTDCKSCCGDNCKCENCKHKCEGKCEGKCESKCDGKCGKDCNHNCKK